ncbi:MAG: P-loop NTPase, partial [Candidatus Heimdallarchaeota archaeon]
MRSNLQQLEQEIKSHMKKVKRKIVVLSGKGGVGKSTVAAN